MYAKLTVDQIIKIHDMELSNSSGLQGIREPGYLNLISEKPFSEFYGEEQYPGLFLKAAVFMEGLIKSHCFFDGNKRTGTLCTYVFLELNGYILDVDDDDLFQKAIEVATDMISIKELSYWLENNSYKE